jgi:hypothetical protein
MVRYRCTRCGGLIEVDESQRGRLHSCPHCHVASAVPAAPSGPARNYRAVNGLIIAGALMSAASLASVIMHSPSAPPAQPAVAQAKPLPVAKSQARPAPAAVAATPPAAVTEVKPTPARAAVVATPPAVVTEVKPTPAPAAVKSAPAADMVARESIAPTPTPVAAVRQGMIVSADFASEKVAMGTAPKISPLHRPWVSRRPDLEPDYISGVVTTRAGRGVGAMVSIKPAPGFTPPTKMHLSATVKSGTHAVAAEDFRGAGVGFFSSDPQANVCRIGFYGVILTPEGKVVLWLGQKSVDASASTPFPGAWNSKAWHTIDLDVDLGIRKLTSVRVDGMSVQFNVATTDFTEANMSYVGILLSATSKATEEMPSAKEITLTALK